jgi:putative hydrolase of the HAD superfamily
MNTMIDTIGFDADDTLWHNENLFSMTQEKFRALLSPYATTEVLDARLNETERRNLTHFGYGIKGFTLSMIETALDVSGGRIDPHDIQAILDAGKAMLAHPVELLDGVRETLERLAGEYQLMVITKGDLFDQESKIARSGLAPLLARVEIVSEKDQAAYRRILGRHGVAPERFLMVGNSIRSDILPVLAIGANAVHVPYPLAWHHEVVEHRGAAAEGFDEIASMDALPALLEAKKRVAKTA